MGIKYLSPTDLNVKFCVYILFLCHRVSQILKGPTKNGEFLVLVRLQTTLSYLTFTHQTQPCVVHVNTHFT